ncbi:MULTISPECIES: DNA polymerase IV [unclassified Oceanobacter]|uniref:DNA polymerase IV n=1 Tax=unclassified Oceanobacter TaxID=2620260 RepID=UPI00273762BA|nr:MULTISPECIES: DNA polymerase IV [unclassified Oceanobacter]MDP2506561.1 DNA polymerase IV [Oceanobacter sp. 3_MG-2023]MDP2609424.1 DNA polymerase IV [Oceanobacter sp. 1_MG-2023]MDP2612876.1 DNA polymerase IV [Oceanobacter sp. 2_MG-2023]
MEMSPRQILHIDCDCFFAAIEMRDQPHLRDRPLAVGGDPARRGVISTCNYNARRYGVRSAMASAHAFRLCPELVLLPTDMPRYRQASQQIMAIMRPYARVFEQVSIDEAYLELTAADDARGVAEAIRYEVACQVGVTVSAGIAPNKYLAKIASDYNKPDGIWQIANTEVAAFVESLPVRKIPGVGPKLSERLAADGLSVCADLQGLSMAHLIHRYGRMGAVLYERCRGIDHRPLREVRERKTVSVEQTFHYDLTSEAECLQQLPDLWQRWQQRVANAGWQADELAPFVKVKFADFTQTTMADNDMAADLKGFAALIASAMRRQDKRVRLLGIGARHCGGDPAQGRLF